MSNWISEEDRIVIRMRMASIKDKLASIENELNQGKSCRSYLLEKIEDVCFDSNAIKRICEEVKDE